MSMDLVLGVMKAADSSKAQNMRQKLTGSVENDKNLFGKLVSLATTRSKEAPTIGKETDILAGVMAAANPERKLAATQALSISPPDERAIAQNTVAENAMKQMEKSMLTTLVNEMVPQGGNALYGDDPAGDFVRDMQVDQIASAVAETEPLSLAQKLYGSGNANDLIKSAQWPYFARQKITPYAT